MALDFPSSPSVGDRFPPPPASPRWMWNGASWVSAPALTGLYLPIAGGTMTGPGNLTVDGLTTLNGVAVVDNDLTVTGDFDVSGATVLDGVTADAITLTAAPTANMEVTNKQYVDEAVAAGGLWQGTWDAENNVPDLTATISHVNAWGWTVTTSDHTTPFTIPATPVIPGLNGVTVYDGDHVIWSSTANAYEVVHGSSLSLQEAQDMFPAKLDAIIRGMPGTYTQGVDFTDFQTFLDANINNRFFPGPLVINLNVDNLNPVSIRNVLFGGGGSSITINSTAQIANSLGITNVRNHTFRINVDTARAYTSATLTNCHLSIGGTNGAIYGNTHINHGTILYLGTAVGDIFTVEHLTLNFGCTATVSDAFDPSLSIISMNLRGTFVIQGGITDLAYAVQPGANGQIIDNRPNSPVPNADTFQRAIPPPLAVYSTPGSHTWRCPRTGRYLVVCCGGGGGGTAWFGNPLNTTSGSQPQFGGGGSGAIARNENLFTAGQLVPMTVGFGGNGGAGGGTTNNGITGAGWGDAGGMSQVNSTGLWVSGGNYGATAPNPPSPWGGNNGGPTTGYTLINGTTGSQTNGGSAVNWTAVTTYYGSITFRGGRGGNPGATGEPGMIGFIYMGPT